MPVYELRTYNIAPGKMPNIRDRFRDHGLPLLKKHDIEVVAFWERATDDGGGQMIYVCKYGSEPEVTERWAAFRADPSWIKAKAESEANGPLVSNITSVIMTPTDFFPAL